MTEIKKGHVEADGVLARRVPNKTKSELMSVKRRSS
jgi:hypothetical protein